MRTSRIKPKTGRERLGEIADRLAVLRALAEEIDEAMLVYLLETAREEALERLGNKPVTR